SYPFVIEPRLRLSEQSVSWLELYYVLLALIAVCAVSVRLLRREANGPEVVIPEPSSGSAASPPSLFEPVGQEAGAEPAVRTTSRVEFVASPLPPASPGAGAGTADAGAEGWGRAPAAAADHEPSPGSANIRRPALGGTLRMMSQQRPSIIDVLFTDPPPREPTIVPDRAWRLRWVLLAFAPSSLLVGVTTYISTDIASIPFLW